MSMQNEVPITLSQVQDLMPSGKRPSMMTCWRWCMVGVKGVKLEHWREGVSIFTTAEAVKRFREKVKKSVVRQRRLQKVG